MEKTIVVGILTSQKIENYKPLIDKSTNEVLSELIHASTNSPNSSLSNPGPINPRFYMRRATLNIILNVVAGVHTTSVNDPLFKRFNKWTDNITRMFSNVNQELDYFPILKYHPGNNMKKVELLKLVCDTIRFKSK